MEYSQHMRIGPVRQNLADEFDPRGFRPSRDGRRLLPRMRHRRGGRSGGAQFRAETGRGGSSFPRRPVLPPPPSLSRPTEEQRGGWIRRRRVDVGAGRGERGPPAHLRSIRRALAASSGTGRAGEEGRFRRDSSLRSRSPRRRPLRLRRERELAARARACELCRAASAGALPGRAASAGAPPGREAIAASAN